MDAECEDVFCDELGLSECFTAHSGTARAQGLDENACRGRCTLRKADTSNTVDFWSAK